MSPDVTFGSGEGREPGARLQRPLASDGIGGSQLGAQFGIGHLPRQVRAGDLGQFLGHRRIGAEIRRLVGLECRVPHLEGFGGITLEELVLLGCEGFVIPWAHPDRRPLKHRQMRGVRARSRARTGWRWRLFRSTRPVRPQSISCDPSSTSGTVRPRNRSAPGISGMLGTSSMPDRGDDGVELSRDTVLGLEPPAALGVRPPQGRDAGARDEVVGRGDCRRRPSPGRRGSPAGWRRSCSTAGSARTNRSRSAMAHRMRRRDRCCCARCRRTRHRGRRS